MTGRNELLRFIADPDHVARELPVPEKEDTTPSNAAPKPEEEKGGILQWEGVELFAETVIVPDAVPDLDYPKHYVRQVTAVCGSTASSTWSCLSVDLLVKF